MKTTTLPPPTTQEDQAPQSSTTHSTITTPKRPIPTTTPTEPKKRASTMHAEIETPTTTATVMMTAAQSLLKDGIAYTTLSEAFIKSYLSILVREGTTIKSSTYPQTKGGVSIQDLGKLSELTHKKLQRLHAPLVYLSIVSRP